MTWKNVHGIFSEKNAFIKYEHTLQLFLKKQAATRLIQLSVNSSIKVIYDEYCYFIIRIVFNLLHGEGYTSRANNILEATCLGQIY